MRSGAATALAVAALALAGCGGDGSDGGDDGDPGADARTVANAKPLWRAAPTAVYAGRAVVTRSGADSECRPVDASAPRRLRGGCVLRLDGRLRLSADRDDARLPAVCDLRAAAWASSPGEVLVDAPAAGGSFCAGVAPCPRPYRQPLEGVFEPDARRRLVLRLDFCVDTATSRYGGPLELAVRPSGRGLLLTPSAEGVGDSGLKATGALALRPVARAAALRVRLEAPEPNG